MSYIDAKQIGNDIYVSEQTAEGNVRTNIVRANYIAYEEDRNGSYRSITGQRLRKISFKSRKELKAAKAEGRLLWESDISPTFRHLEQAYPDDGKLPDLHISIYDIEVDRDPERGYSTTKDPFNPLTSVTVYHKWLNQAITIAVPPPGMSMERAIELVNDEFNEDGYGKLDEDAGYFIVYTEGQLLELFLEIIQDSHCLSGWNCILDTESLWLDDRIIQLKNSNIGDCSKHNGEILNKSNSEYKKGNVITLQNNITITASDDHRFPIAIKHKDKYRNSNTIENETELLPVSSIKTYIDGDIYDCYARIPINNNTNEDLTYRTLILDNIQKLLDSNNFDIVLPILECEYIKSLVTCKTVFNYHTGYYCGKNYNYNHPLIWRYKRWSGYISIENIIKLLTREEHVYIIIKKRKHLIRLSDVISNDVLQILGLIFTDGSTDWKRYNVSIYSSFGILRKEYSRLIYDSGLGTGRWGKEYKRNSRTRFHLSGRLYLLLLLIYEKHNKKLNLSLLSKLSYNQFINFFSGIVDGDGTVSKGRVCVCNYENQVGVLCELLLWNGILASHSINKLWVYKTKANDKIIDDLRLYHPNKRNKLSKTQWSRNNSNKIASIYERNDCYWIKIKHITSADLVPMMDIETEKSYFISNGIEVHNCSLYDMPMIIARIRIVLGGETLEDVRSDIGFNPSENSIGYLQKLCLFPVLPEIRSVERYGTTETAYELFGRRDIDYMLYYKKFVKAEELKLDGILKLEVGQSKVQYDGTIDQFYRNDFRRFLAYNRQDVMGLSAVDDKKKLIALANQMIHMSGVTMDKAIGSVAIIEQAILRELHRKIGEIAWDKQDNEPDYHVPGAFVVEPTAGLYGWGGSYDVNSLYPTMIRLLNISPETLIGQLDISRTNKLLNNYVDDILGIPVDDRLYNLSHRMSKNAKAVDQAYTEAWHRFTGVLEYHDVIEESQNLVTLEKTDKNRITLSGKDMKKLILDSNWCITANGTVFTLEKEGIIPYCLTKWYHERQQYQKEAGNYKSKLLESHNSADVEQIKEFTRLFEYYDMIQDGKKKFLNSTYGAYLNRHFRFYDPRCGRSVTLSGRVVVKHMCKKSGEILSGKYDFTKEVLLAGDTDSVASDSMIDTPDGKISIEALFNSGNITKLDNGQEISIVTTKTNTYFNNSIVWKTPKLVYRHKTTKPKYKVKIDGKTVLVTGDHSLVVFRDCIPIEIRAKDIKPGDLMMVKS